MSAGGETGPAGQPHDRNVRSATASRERSTSPKSLPPFEADSSVPKSRFSTDATEIEQGDGDSLGKSPPSRSLNDTLASSSSHRRDRGYSLRRSIFSQNMQRENATMGASIELRAPSSRMSQTLKSTGTAKRETTITISERVDDEGPLARPIRLPDPKNGLPTYGRWVLKQAVRSSLFCRAKTACMGIPDRLFTSKPLPPSPDGRHVRVNASRSVQLIDERVNKPHVSNLIISCRYTPWNFVPRQLTAQFGKLANFYFLCVSILQMIPGLSTTGTYTTIIPLLIFVGISMAKEGYDDIRRHRLDKEENERLVDVLDARALDAAAESLKRQEAAYPETATTGWRKEKWQHVRVGDVLLLERDCPVPADVVLLHADEPTGSAYIETKSLDGETNLKSKKPLADVSGRCSNLDSLAYLEADFVVEDPNLDLYKFDGKVVVGGDTLPLTNGEIIYRGSVLRNTTSALGLVIYSGEECKIRMNANKIPRVKAPALQSVVNKVIIFIAGLVFFIAILMTGLYQVWKKSTESDAFYLETATVPFGQILVSFVIMFNTMLPLSLYVALEIVKVAQMFLMNDVDMYDPESDTPMESHTSTINEELGQVSYIFSDKTGTLTNNSMKFRKMSVAGSAWLHDLDLQEEALHHTQPKLLHKKRGWKGKDKISSRQSNISRKSTASHIEGAAGSCSAMQDTEWKLSSGFKESLHCGKTEQFIEYLSRKPHSPFARKAKLFILGLVLCNTCMPEKDDEGNLSFQAASPDELALVNAALDLGYVMTNRQSNSITIKTYPSGEDDDPIYEIYEILDVIDFSSARKRMSIIIRLPDGRICLLTKGADTTIRKLLRLADLAVTAVSDVRRRASERKSTEVQEVLRRRSTQLPSGTHKSRSSLVIPSGPSNIGRNSSISFGRGRTTRESVDLWLKEKEVEVELATARHSNIFYTPRPSIQVGSPRFSGPLDPRKSFARTDSAQASVRMEDIDDLIDDAIVLSERATFERCFQHVDDFATEGLRTLLYGYRLLDDEEYRDWREIYTKASTSLVDRQEKVEAAAELIELRLELLGATAIEDKLQRGVPDAIDRFRRAGIKIWMLTGDKRETAINIGHSCRLIKDYSTVIILDHDLGNLHDRMTNALADITGKQTAHSVLVIDGQTLTLVDVDSAAKTLFTDLAVLADSVICCRASPSQKASLVRMIRLKVKGSVTLAVGDGANDIAMIQEAHLGIGIAGKEGLQAAKTSDYSIAQFRFLLKLLLVHGRWNYIRICKYILGTFWKETLFYLVQAMYQRWTGYTGTSLYEPWSLSMFNTLFTSLPVIFMGVFEKDLAASTLLAVPELYSIGPKNGGFNFKLYAYWATLAATEAVIVYFTMYSIYGDALFTRDNQLYAMGCLAFSSCITIISLKLQFVQLHNKSVAAVIAIILSVGGWWMWNLALSGFYPKDNPVYFVNHGIIDEFGRNPLWWLTLILIVLAVVLLEVLLKIVWSTIRPTDVDTFQAYEQDIEIRKRFEEAAADLLQQGWDRGTKKSSLELAREAQEQTEREAQVQELLDRPRTMEEPAQGIRRRHSQPTEDAPVKATTSKSEEHETTRRSIDVGELFSKGFGMVKKGERLK